MDIDKIVSELSNIEKNTLKNLDKTALTEKEISQKSKLNIDSVRRSVNWLQSKELIEIQEDKKTIYVLTKNGEQAKEQKLPEIKILETLKNLKGKSDFKTTQEKSGLEGPVFNIALGLAKRNNWITISPNKELQLSGLEEDVLNGNYLPQKIIDDIEKYSKEKEILELIKRGLVEQKEISTKKITLNKNGENALKSPEFNKERKYDINAPVPTTHIGKRQPYIQFLNQIRQKLVSLGFKEMESPIITQEFYNFDVLFQPQNHPARTWTDTYQLKQPTRGKISNREKVKAIKAAHETGGVTVSTGWGYSWAEEVAEKLMPSAHATAHSARQLVKGVEKPSKYFAISRCYRPDVLDATHLIEFNQMDGFIIDDDLSFKNLLGMLKQFATEVAGATEVRFYPDYYPFTEPSVQLSAKHPDLGWIEFAGAGIFRPEMTENLGLGNTPVIAWGMGIDRLAMFKMGIKDIRYLFSDDLTWLRNAPLIGVD